MHRLYPRRGRNNCLYIAVPLQILSQSINTNLDYATFHVYHIKDYQQPVYYCPAKKLGVNFMLKAAIKIAVCFVNFSRLSILTQQFGFLVEVENKEDISVLVSRQHVVNLVRFVTHRQVKTHCSGNNIVPSSFLTAAIRVFCRQVINLSRQIKDIQVHHHRIRQTKLRCHHNLPPQRIPGWKVNPP